MNKYLMTMMFAIAIASSAFAQTKKITSSDFYKANIEASDLMEDYGRRIIIKTETIENGIVITSVTKIEERLLPDKLRFFTVEKKGGAETSSELIVIGTKEYRRENNGQWTIKNAGGSGSGSGIGSGSACIQYTEESDFVNGATARKLKQLMINDTAEGLSYDEFTYWYDLQGLILRSERLKGLLDPKIERIRSVGTFDYDPKDLKIEAPIK